MDLREKTSQLKMTAMRKPKLNKNSSVLLKAGLFLGILAAFPACQCSGDDKDPVDTFTQSEAAAEGLEIVSASEATLKGVLMSKVQVDGFEGAVEYCKVHAAPLTDSLSLVFNADVRRTSFRYRSQNNAPDSVDRIVLSKYEENYEFGGSMDPLVEEVEEGQFRYYSPIRVQPLCLNCHGMPGESLTADLHALILETYPEDRAVGYEIGDFRGAWVVEFAKSMQ